MRTRNLAAIAAVVSFIASCESSRATPVDGGTDAVDLGPPEVDRGLPPDRGADQSGDPCAGGCDWCAADTCPQLCAPGACNGWAPVADDFDDDGIADAKDTCPFVSDPAQRDDDGDGVGDLCDACPKVPDAEQLDTDGDGQGDACDPDLDNDGVVNDADDCPAVPNPASGGQQADADDDGQGDLCDADADGDGVPNVQDNCPLVANPEQLDTDPNKYGEACDADTDLDNVMDSVDNCPSVANPQQEDADDDDVGDACDADQDGDGVGNLRDNCPAESNPDQADADRDDRGDACDPKFCFAPRAADGSVDQQSCLDPKVTFRVLCPALRGEVGAVTILPLYVNREQVKVRYAWSVIKRPARSIVDVLGDTGECTSTKQLACPYPEAAPAAFVPDQRGSYEIKVTAELVGPDPRNPSWPAEGAYVVTLTVEDPHGNAGKVCIPDQCY